MKAFTPPLTRQQQKALDSGVPSHQVLTTEQKINQLQADIEEGQRLYNSGQAPPEILGQLSLLREAVADLKRVQPCKE